MTRYENKEYNYLKIDYERYLIPELILNNGNLSFSIRRFCSRAMDLLEEYHIKDIQYRERIKTLKEIIKNSQCKTIKVGEDEQKSNKVD